MFKAITFILIALACAAAFAAGERGWFGFATSIKGEGHFWNPTLVSITIEGVTPGSPAALQNVVKGDQVLEVEGKVVSGTKGSEIKAILESKAPGDKLVVRLKHSNGEESLATLVAQRRPEK